MRLRLIWMLSSLPATTIRPPSWPPVVLPGMVSVIFVSQGPGISIVTPVTSRVGRPSVPITVRLPSVMPFRPALSISFSTTNTSTDGPPI